MFKKIIILLLSCAVLTLLGCTQEKTPADVIKVGTIAGPETKLLEVAKGVAKRCYGLNIIIVAFTDYNTPNAALNDGSIGANMFQHKPFLDKAIQERGYDIVSVGKTFIYPMGVYSNKIQHLSQLKQGDKVAIPNDPSNETRALLLLQKAGLITLKPKITVLGTISDIQLNHKQLKFVALNAAQLPRSLSDVTIAVINTNFAIPAGLSPSKALYAEAADSPYANVVVVHKGNTELPKVKELVASLHSKEVLQAAKQIFGDGALPAWNVGAPVMPCKK